MKVNVFSLHVSVVVAGGVCSLILSWSETDYNWQSVEWLGPASDALGDFLVTIGGDMITLPPSHNWENWGQIYQMFLQEIDSKFDLKTTSSRNKTMIQVMDGSQKPCMFHIELILNISLLCKCPKLTLFSLVDTYIFFSKI